MIAYLQTHFDEDFAAKLSKQWKKNVNHTRTMPKATLERRKSGKPKFQLKNSVNFKNN